MINHRRLNESEKEDIIREVEDQYMLIVEQVMQFYEVVKPHENCLVTLKKGYSKFIFDKTWYEDIIKVKDEHYKQMAIILGYADKIQLDQDTWESIKI